MVTLTIEIFIQRSLSAHGATYDYSSVEYRNAKQKVSIICPIHGAFLQSPDKHMGGQGCPRCKPQRLANVFRRPLEEFITKARLTHGHGDNYLYDEVIYKTNVQPVLIICKHHGAFYQAPIVHLHGHGCTKCGRERTKRIRSKSPSQFVLDAQKIHADKYDYQLTSYINAQTKVNISCKKHGVFSQTAHDHLSGFGCPRCGNRISKDEKQWLDTMQITHRQFTIVLNDTIKKVVDGYDPETNTVYEFYGDFWHGNPAKYEPEEINPRVNCTMGDLHKQTLESERLLRSAGYIVISIWEQDWKVARAGLPALAVESQTHDATGGVASCGQPADRMRDH